MAEESLFFGNKKLLTAVPDRRDAEWAVPLIYPHSRSSRNGVLQSLFLALSPSLRVSSQAGPRQRRFWPLVDDRTHANGN